MEKRLLSVTETAKVLGISRSFVYKLVESDSIPVIRLGRALRFDMRHLEIWLDAIAAEDEDKADELQRERE